MVDYTCCIGTAAFFHELNKNSLKLIQTAESRFEDIGSLI